MGRERRTAPRLQNSFGSQQLQGPTWGIPLGHQPCTQFLVDSSLPLTAPHAPLLPQRVCRCRHTPSRFSTCRGWCGEGGRAAQAGRIRSMRCRRVFVGAGGPTEHYSGKATGVVEPFLAARRGHIANTGLYVYDESWCPLGGHHDSTPCGAARWPWCSCCERTAAAARRCRGCSRQGGAAAKENHMAQPERCWRVARVREAMRQRARLRHYDWTPLHKACCLGLAEMMEQTLSFTRWLSRTG